MKLLSGALLLRGLPLSSATSAKYGVRRGDQEPLIYVPLDENASGTVHMAMMATLTSVVDEMCPAGDSITEYTCSSGYAGKDKNNTYSCRNLDFVPLHAAWFDGQYHRPWRRYLGLGAHQRRSVEGVWPDRAIWGHCLAYLGRLPTQTETSIWRDMEVIGNYAYIGSEAPGHGIQVFN
ncbi:hypothetical protein DFH08DRAFT_797264 [Mycena albidolilacea]|uniref:Carboxylic ester hydrolase n=1 Tax=Mycena albidolilacea TaxID=1033008 RepID=A0AAD7AQQ8_9AGAR|nr:hypothetical protein DFH08DRAFT_797264 [Mycena albidolilacea]